MHIFKNAYKKTHSCVCFLVEWAGLAHSEAKASVQCDPSGHSRKDVGGNFKMHIFKMHIKKHTGVCFFGGDNRTRTCDPLHVKQVL